MLLWNSVSVAQKPSCYNFLTVMRMSHSRCLQWEASSDMLQDWLLLDILPASSTTTPLWRFLWQQLLDSCKPKYFKLDRTLFISGSHFFSSFLFTSSRLKWHFKSDLTHHFEFKIAMSNSKFKFLRRTGLLLNQAQTWMMEAEPVSQKIKNLPLPPLKWVFFSCFRVRCASH